MSFLSSPVFSTKSENKGRFCLEVVGDGGNDQRRGEVAQKMYTRVSKCKKDKIK
jgi:hypothetical protein